MFSLAVMSFTVTLALDAILAVTASFWAGKLLLGSNAEGVTSVAMQQGGLGLFMTALIVSAPPMAAAFFQGTIGQFAAYNQFGQNASSGGGGQQRLPDGRPLGATAPTNTGQSINTHANSIQTPNAGAMPLSGNNPAINPAMNNAAPASSFGARGAANARNPTSTDASS